MQKECQCFNDPYGKLRVYCGGCSSHTLFKFKLITPELLNDEKLRKVKIRNWKQQESIEFDGYDEYVPILRKCKIDYILSIVSEK